LFGANTEDEFIYQIQKTFGPGAIEVFIDSLCAIWAKQTVFRAEAAFLTLQGGGIDAIVSYKIPETEEGFRNVPVTIIDVTKRKQAEIELSNLRNYLSNIIDSMPSVLIGVDTDGIVTQWNAMAEQSTGIIKSEAHGKNISAVYPRMTLLMEKVLESIQAREVLREQKIAHPSEGGIIFEDMTIYPLIANGVLGAVIRIDDVTERVQLENMMVQTEKMSSVAGLAAGMAHEINNPLGGIMQGYQNILNRINPDKPKNQEAAAKFNLNLSDMYNYLADRKIITFLNGGRDACERAAGIVKNMLQFSRKTDSILAPSDLAYLIDHTIELGASDYDMKKKYDFKFVDIIKDYEPKLPTVMCCPSELEQVLLNLFKNALQAMEEVKRDGYKPQFHIRLIKETGFIRIEVEDNGPGMPSYVKTRIFEPFFTTKQVGTGTGLGLSVSYMIITKNHSGTFDVESEEGMGTKFIIRLPI